MRIRQVLVALVALLSASSPSLSSAGATSCINEGRVFALQATETVDGLRACQAVELVSLGRQTYYDDELSTSPQRVDVDVWESVVAPWLTTTERESQWIFLAWERLEPQSDAHSYDGILPRKPSWSERLHVALSASNATKASSSSLSHTHDTHPSVQSPMIFHATDVIAHEHVELMDVRATYAFARVASLDALLSLSRRLPKDTRMARLTPVASSVDDDDDDDDGLLPVPRFVPPLHALLFSEALSVHNLRTDARILTGEDAFGQSIVTDEVDDAVIGRATKHWHSRHSGTPEARLAAAWIRARMERDLAPIGATCVEWSYDSSFSPNVVCTIPAYKERKETPVHDSLVLFSAHYDSRGSFGFTRAPGGDDDASGTTMLLALARHLGTHKIRFRREVRLVAFSGEEQGLVGSQHYAAHLRKAGTRVLFQLQTDMIGFRKPGEPLQVAFPDRLATANATAYVMAIAKLYVPELHVGYTPACCSDHQSFWEQGYTSTWIFERRGPIADPCYHDTCDVTDRKGYDFDQIKASTRLVLATLLDVAGGVDWPW